MAMIKFPIRNRYTGATQYVAELDCDEATVHSLKVGLAVMWALKNSADLSEADLRGAYLYGANLSVANLRGADLRGAYLRGADLSGAYLYGASLSKANLSEADLSEAYLSSAYLYGANLNSANLSGANLNSANLRGADLRGAYLSSANLSRADLSLANLVGAKWSDDITIQREPLFLSGLAWPVIILDEHMRIGCELHRLAEWAAFDDRRIARMAGADAVRFWRANKDALLALAAADGRGVTPETAEASGEAA